MSGASIDAAIEAVSRAAQRHAADYDALRDHLADLHRRLDEVRSAAMPAIRAAARAAAESRDALAAEVERHDGLWSGRRKTVVVHGFRVGRRKGKGSLLWDSAEAVVRRIRREFAELSESLIRTREEPIKSALLELSAAELKRLGCRVEGTGEETVISPVGDNIDRIVEKLLEDSDQDRPAGGGA